MPLPVKGKSQRGRVSPTGASAISSSKPRDKLIFSGPLAGGCPPACRRPRRCQSRRRPHRCTRRPPTASPWRSPPPADGTRVRGRPMRVRGRHVFHGTPPRLACRPNDATSDLRRRRMVGHVLGGGPQAHAGEQVVLRRLCCHDRVVEHVGVVGLHPVGHPVGTSNQNPTLGSTWVAWANNAS